MRRANLVEQATEELSVEEFAGCRATVRRGRGFGWQATSFRFHPTIFTTQYAMDPECCLVHEFGHIRSGDHVFYEVIKPIMLVAVISYFSAVLHNLFLVTTWNLGGVDPEFRTPMMFLIAYMFVVVFIGAFMITYLLFLAPHEREYLADLSALKVLGERYRSFLENEDRWASTTVPNSFFVSWYNRFTHPSLGMRVVRLGKNHFTLLQASFWSGALSGSNLLFLSFFERIASGRTRVHTLSYSFDVEILVVIAYLFIFAISFLYASSVIAFSVQEMPYKKALVAMFRFLLGYAIIGIFTTLPLDALMESGFLQAWLQEFYVLMRLAVCLFALVFCLWLEAKRQNGLIERNTIKGNIGACLSAAMLLGILEAYVRIGLFYINF